MAKETRTLTEEELCEIAEIRNRLARLIYEADDNQVTAKDILYCILLDTDEIKEGMRIILFDDDTDDTEDIKDEVLPTKSEEETPK